MPIGLSIFKSAKDLRYNLSENPEPYSARVCCIMTLYSAGIHTIRCVGAIPHEGYLYISATNPPSKDALDKGLSTYFLMLTRLVSY